MVFKDFIRNSILFCFAILLTACSEKNRAVPDAAPDAEQSSTEVEGADEQKSALQEAINQDHDTQQSVTQSGQAASLSDTKVIKRPSEYVEVEWTDLMPKEELEALSNPPEYLNDIEDGSLEDQIGSEMKAGLVEDIKDPYQMALVSTRVVPEMDGKAVKIPGFVVPLEFGEDQTITKFFLVPFFGACIHVPPPPPNQIIMVNYRQGLQLEALYDPFWISGVLSTTLVENEMATAAYSLEMFEVEDYRY